MPAKKEVISLDTVRHVAKIARLRLTEKEAKKFQIDLNDILESFKVIDKLDTTKVEPSFQPLPVQDVVRRDYIEPCLDRERALANTRHKQEGFYKGPRAV